VYRIQLTILLLLCSIYTWAQDAETDDTGGPPDETAVEDETEVTDEDIDALLGIGEEDYADSEDDDFDPTESVRFEQSIPFPVDI
jgi:hypothetical protein